MNRIVIVGGVAGGMSAATRLRRLDESAEIIVIEKSGYVSYANCGLPYYIGGVIKDESSLLLQSPESLKQRFNIDVRINSQGVKIDRENKTLLVENLTTKESYLLSYDKLILSPGAAPIRPQIPGIERALSLRSVEDTQKIFSQVATKPASAVVIGGGFIGVEVAENLVHQGIKTSIVEASSQLLAPLDPEMAYLVNKEMVTNGVDLYLGLSASQITEREVCLNDGQCIAAELVILAIGVKPETSLASDAGLKIGVKGGIVVDKFNLTSDPDIYAAGDATEKIDALDNNLSLVPLANIANRQGRVIADHINGRKVREVKTIGSAIVKVFDLAIATTGWNEKRLISAKRDYRVIHTHPGSHAGYYPGASTMAIKLIFDPKSGEIFGGQAIGRDGIDKRIDVIATAIRSKITAPELADLELAYAPPYGSAKDPINMLGYIAENIISGLTQSAQWNEIDKYLEAGYILLDVRNEDEFARGVIPGSINIPLDQLRERHSEIKAKKVLITCQVGQRGHSATLLMKNLGYEAVNLDGGYHLWSNSPAQIEQMKVGV
ncbi:MAG: FAD-dependent oxidoreductase [Actinobacteria bacterium]|nr:FAD-dependent oxidoreductase [Actinomycetota bacterium]